MDYLATLDGLTSPLGLILLYEPESGQQLHFTLSARSSFSPLQSAAGAGAASQHQWGGRWRLGNAIKQGRREYMRAKRRARMHFHVNIKMLRFTHQGRRNSSTQNASLIRLRFATVNTLPPSDPRRRPFTHPYYTIQMKIHDILCKSASIYLCV